MSFKKDELLNGITGKIFRKIGEKEKYNTRGRIGLDLKKRLM